MSVYNELPTDEQNEDEQIITIGDDILSSFYYGNYSQGIKEMIDYNVHAEELIEYLEDKADEYGCKVDDLYGGHFDRKLCASIGYSWLEAFRENLEEVKPRPSDLNSRINDVLDVIK